MATSSETIKSSLNIVENELKKYTDWGYSSELSDTVDVLIECRNKLRSEYKKRAEYELSKL